MPAAPMLIEAESVSREYRLGETVIRAVDAVSLNVETGEFLALFGKLRIRQVNAAEHDGGA